MALAPPPPAPAALRLALAVLAVVAVACSALPARPKYIQCVDNSECGPWECCVVGMGRYSLPRCAAVGDIGDSCRMPSAHGAGAPVNVTVGYPDGTEVNLTAVHFVFCPCAAGLQCDGYRAACAAPAEHELNAL